MFVCILYATQRTDQTDQELIHGTDECMRPGCGPKSGERDTVKRLSAYGHESTHLQIKDFTLDYFFPSSSLTGQLQKDILTLRHHRGEAKRDTLIWQRTRLGRP